MKKGFTLIELLAVIAILALMSIAAGVSYLTISNKHKKNNCNAFVDQLKNAAIQDAQDNMRIREGGSKSYTIESLIKDRIIDVEEDEARKVMITSYDTAKDYEITVSLNNGKYTASINPADICE